MPSRFDVAVVGGGIVGLGTAWAAQRNGGRVLLVERSPQPQGASIRNFGMLWPVGQPAGPRRKLALRSRLLWSELAEAAGLWLEPCGSLHLAHHDDEWELLREFVSLEANRSSELPMQLLTPTETRRQTRLANPEGLRGALWSPSECRIDPRQALQRFPEYLGQQGVEVRTGTNIVRIEDRTLTSSAGEQWQADQIYVCSGSDLQTLFPEQFAALELSTCKLHMLRTDSLPDRARIGPHLASGLTLRHYPAFADCNTLGRLKQRVVREHPELDRYGIHVMVSQDQAGRLILGDSHQYDEDIEPFDKQEIDRLILCELRKVYALPTWHIDARWTGYYVKHPDVPAVIGSPEPGVTLITGLGGGGMTLSLALAEQTIQSPPLASNLLA